MYGQMTAGSWIYIGTQGILQGTYETFAAVAAKKFGGTLAGTITLTAGLGGMGGAQPLAVTMNDGVAICIDVDPSRIARRIEHALPRRRGATTSTHAARAGRTRPATPRRRCRSACSATPPSVVAAAARDGRRRSTSSPTRPAPTTRCAYLPLGVALRRLGRGAQRDPRASPSAPASRWPCTSRRWSASSEPAPRSSTTATTSAPRRSLAGYADAFAFPGFVPAYIRPLFCEGKGPFRWAALSGDPSDIAKTDRAVLELFPENESLARWIKLGRERVQFQGLPARICWLGYGERDARRASVQRHGRVGRARRADRDRPRPPRRGFGRVARTARPRRCSTARTRSPTGRCSTRWSTPRRARPGCRSTTAAGSASAAASTPGRSRSPTARRWPARSSRAC